MATEAAQALDLPPASAAGTHGGLRPASCFSLNPEARLHVETLSSGCPVMVIDDFYAQPMAVRALALAGQYDSSRAYYPGLHAQIAPDPLAPLLDALVQLMSALGSLQCRPEDITTDFSIVTTPAREMLANQKHPHVDGLPLAGVLYLNPDFEIGTSFFRHRPTGQAFVRHPHEQEAYGRWLAEHSAATQPDTYAVGDDATWEHLHTVAGRFNRLVMYPGTAFHSIAMRDVAEHLTLDSVRLTQRFFINRGNAH